MSKQRTVQAVVKETTGAWVPGRSVCYKDETYSRTQRTTRWKFVSLEELPGSYAKQKLMSTKIKRALRREGYKSVEDVMVFYSEVWVYSRSPIQIVDL